MKLLAINTSTAVCSTALQVDERSYVRDELQPQQHTQVLLAQINALLEQAGLILSALDGIALAIGPGSFTGLRIGASVVQALSFAHNIPTIGISSLALFAQAAFRLYSADKAIIAIDARMEGIYHGLYELSDNKIMLNADDDRLLSPQHFQLPQGQDWLGVGDAWMAYPELMAEKYPARGVEAGILPEGQDLLPLAIARYGQHYLNQPGEISLNYLRQEVVKKSQKQ
ncbi:MAG: tRNA (adenosine(37)-N6)-threonylcarbamoyltransferase complex dimerization subunit type 1 TsaB [Legionellales bacterium]|nr:tRNA (adenosine(37)-N6)-threonylcarbamoyltransferase complex dimerization subunit type 1 TsaB [Legionellales bacterium]|tara:strand:+ start:6969 stop:7649 length:681 start_codon:yes stop_codon:yes gene_type:complete